MTKMGILIIFNVSRTVLYGIINEIFFYNKVGKLFILLDSEVFQSYILYVICLICSLIRLSVCNLGNLGFFFHYKLPYSSLLP